MTIRLVLAGATVGNDNRGVEALSRSVIDAVDSYAPGASLSVLDDGRGVRSDESGQYTANVEYVGVRQSFRWHRSESWARVRAAQAVRSRSHPVATRLARSDALLDLSAGDSFTDLYGRKRLAAVSAPKKAALRANRPLVLLPQTYGPFTTGEGRAIAETLVRRATLAYSRDGWSHTQLLELAGGSADHTRIREGVDVAFALSTHQPPAPVADRLRALSGEVVAGVNVSGLLTDRVRKERFGLTGSYLDTMTAIVRALIARGVFVVLVPHVHGGWGESDLGAGQELLASLDVAERARTWMVPAELRASELKWCIARTEWFLGSRMHATVAALSSRVPAFGYAYSDKTRGVFATCGVADEVADARALTGAGAVEAAMASFDRRAGTRTALDLAAPAVVERSRNQVRDLLAEVQSWQGSSEEIGAIA